MIKQAIPVVIFILLVKILPAQPCTVSGHTPSSAVLLCGSSSYVQASIPSCTGSGIPSACSGSFSAMNATWFKMTAFSSGTLGFTISPFDPEDNFDWQLFDISGRNNDDVFTDPSLFLACNWSPVPGETGASAIGDKLTVCSEAGADVFSKMPNIIQGREYLLLVSQRTNLPTGFQISVGGGTGSVTDPVEPNFFNARLSCDGNQVYVLLNKKMRCTSIALNGSDFSIDAPAAIVSAAPADCNLEGEANFIVLSLSNSVPSGNYTLTMQNGADANTILDKCARNIPPGSTVPVIPPSTESPLPDSLRIPACSPGVLKVVFRKPVQCNSIALNGSDFSITGPQPVIINNVTFTCNTANSSGPTTSEVQIHLAMPLTTGGAYDVVFGTGTDGSPVVDECGNAISPGSKIPFIAIPSVSALFSYTASTSCKEDTIRFSHTIPTGVISWRWMANGSDFANTANPVKIFPSEGDQEVKLIVTNGSCNDTVSQTISLNNKVTAAFEIPPIICPEDTLRFINTSSNNTDIWQWDFGGNITSSLHSPPALHYPITGRETFYTIRLVVRNSTASCIDSMVKKVRVLSGCYIAVPTAFTPNNDGVNDTFYPLNALKADNLVFRVFNRQGQLVFATKDWTKSWDGTIKGMPQPTGVYTWFLSFIHRDTGEKIFQKGTTVLIR